MSGTLSSVVSSLVRASMGSSVPNALPEDDVDRYVAELILKEAKQKAERYGAQGIRAYLPQAESNAPRTNKRFLSSIIRSTDDHNKTILRAQALAAQEVRLEREEEERRERRARAEEAAAAERVRRLMGRASSGWDANWDHGKQREREREQRKRARSVDDDDDDYSEGHSRHSDRKRRRHHHRHRRHRHRSYSSDRDDRGGRNEERKSRSPDRRLRDDYESRRRRSHRPRSPKRSDENSTKHTSRGDGRHGRSPRRRGSLARKYSRSRSPGDSRPHGKRRRSLSPDHSTYITGEDEASPRVKRSRRSPSAQAHDREVELCARPEAGASPPPRETEVRTSLSQRPSRSPTMDLDLKRHRSSPKDSTSSSQTAIGPPTPSLSPLPPSNLPSKMDKYFEESYDPRLDVAPLSVPTIPLTGLISDAQFEGWDAMLELIKLRREDKEEKKKLERMGLSTKDSKGKKSSAVAVGDKWESSGGAGSIMDIEYKKKGAVREWDLGKEGF